MKGVGRGYEGLVGAMYSGRGQGGSSQGRKVRGCWDGRTGLLGEPQAGPYKVKGSLHGVHHLQDIVHAVGH